MSEEELKVYYNYLYPFDTLVRWLTYSNKYQLAHRELSFEYKEAGVERYVTFATSKAMKSRMISRFQVTPLKVDAGAIWNRVPLKDSNGHTVQRELIFDFDMNDYDDVRTCCSGKNVCVKCWKLLIVAVDVIQKALEQDFGFWQLMFVFSGGRGLHIWVCDPEARKLKDSVRKAIVDYLQLVTGNEKAASLLSQKVIEPHPTNTWWRGKHLDGSREQIKEFLLRQRTSSHVQRSLAILSKYFLEIMIEQRAFIHQTCIDIILKIVSNRNVHLMERVKDRLTRCKNRLISNPDAFLKTSEDAQNQIIKKLTLQSLKQLTQQVERYQQSQTVDDYINRINGNRYHRITFVEEQIMLSFLYPRMDYNVSTMQNHLLKLPFSVHPSSRKISIPLLRRQLQDFDPKKCVNLKDLLNIIEEYHKEGFLEGKQNEQIAKTTPLSDPIKAMEQFILQLQ